MKNICFVMPAFWLSDHDRDIVFVLQQPLSSANFLYELDKITQDVLMVCVLLGFLWTLFFAEFSVPCELSYIQSPTQDTHWIIDWKWEQWTDGLLQVGNKEIFEMPTIPPMWRQHGMNCKSGTECLTWLAINRQKELNGFCRKANNYKRCLQRYKKTNLFLYWS